ncbi:hypothetical protein AKO1_011658 [Acrasis kona]|uniref:Uncharacterized protein n=1 Tax=Acrasis kona TaxID=1008807 RepID=A0AAW2Z933_9EUKA
MMNLKLVLVLFCVAVQCQEYRTYCWPNVVGYKAEGLRVNSTRDGTYETRVIESHKLDRTKGRYRSETTYINSKNESYTESSIGYEKTPTQAFVYQNYNGVCSCVSVTEVDIVGCSSGSSSKVGDLIKIENEFDVVDDDERMVGNNTKIVKPLGHSNDAIFISLEGGHVKSKKDVLLYKHWYTYKYLNVKQQVQDSDFILPKEWNCPKESECRILLQPFTFFIQNKF